MIIRYDSTAALRSAYIEHCGMPLERPAASRRFNHYDNSPSWYGGESAWDSVRYAELGRLDLVPKAEKLLSELDLAIATPEPVWNPSPVGYYLDVGDYLADAPDCMRTIEFEADERAPITILATTTSSAGISADTLQKRGTVILALVMALSRIRPVNLQQLTFTHGVEGGETIITSGINTAPLDLARACYVLTSAGFARRLTYGIAEKLNRFNGMWPNAYRYGQPRPYLEYLKRVLTPDPSKTLIIGAAELGDELLRNPVEWVTKQVNHFTHGEAETSDYMEQ